MLDAASTGTHNTAYGTFTVAADGTWSYALDQTKADGLKGGEPATDSLTVTSLDGKKSLPAADMKLDELMTSPEFQKIANTQVTDQGEMMKLLYTLPGAQLETNTEVVIEFKRHVYEMALTELSKFIPSVGHHGRFAHSGTAATDPTTEASAVQAGQDLDVDNRVLALNHQDTAADIKPAS